jgi:hypothetical protein
MCTTHCGAKPRMQHLRSPKYPAASRTHIAHAHPTQQSSCRICKQCLPKYPLSLVEPQHKGGSSVTATGKRNDNAAVRNYTSPHTPTILQSSHNHVNVQANHLLSAALLLGTAGLISLAAGRLPHRTTAANMHPTDMGQGMQLQHTQLISVLHL